MLACHWAERCHSVPSPHVGEGQGGGYNKQRPVSPIRDSITALSISRTCTGSASHRVLCRHPSPCPSPTWGEGTVWHAPSQLTTSAIRDVCMHALAPSRGRQRKRFKLVPP